MPDAYLIDGYNLLHALGMVQRSMAPGGLETARVRLLNFLAQTLGDRSSNATVVFDARQAPHGVPRVQQFQQLLVRFAPKNQSADDLIETLIEQALDPARLVVISNDSRLQNAARRGGARAWSHEQLLDFLDRQPTPPADSILAEEKQDKVTPAEVEAWLKEFGDLEKDPSLREYFDHDTFE